MSGDKLECFWMTLNILVGLDRPRVRHFSEDVEEWLESVSIRNNSSGSGSKNTNTSRSSGTNYANKSKINRRRPKKTDNEEKEVMIELPKVACNFSHPKVRSRLEKLMGSNLVRLTDRKYMQKLHSRILEDYIQSMNKRIAAREQMEREREKTLVLTGKVPMDQAPPEMSGHPVLLINAYCDRLIAERRAKIKVPKVVIPNYLYVDDTPDPPPALSIADGHVFRSGSEQMCIPPEFHLVYSDEEDVDRGYMFPEEEFERRFVYESPQIKELGLVETVEEMYALADEIIGPLKTIDDKK